MADAAYAVQKGVYDRLAAALSGTTVVDYASQDQAAFPYVQVGEIASADASAVGYRGEDHRLTVHAWDRARGSKGVRQLMADVKDALHEQEAQITLPAGTALVNCRHLSSEDFDDADGLTRHGVMRFRIATVQS